MFNSGSTHSFISLSFVRKAQLGVEPLGYEVLVSTPSGVILMTCEKVKRDKVEVFGYDVIFMTCLMVSPGQITMPKNIVIIHI